MASSDDTMLDQWDKKIHCDRLGMKYSGCYYGFQSLAEGELSSGSDDVANTKADIFADTPCILTSCSKVFAGTAVMRTMHLAPDDWYPEKPMHEFKGWEEWKNFPVHDNVDGNDTAGWEGRIAPQITVHQLLTHTSGWPFGLQGSRNRILNIPLYFEPGTNFGYSIGHRILGWMMLDYWKAKDPARFKCLNDVFSWLVYEPLGLKNTFFIQGHLDANHSIMGRFFEMSFFDDPNDTSARKDDDPADLSLASSGEDMMKLGMMALRRGTLENGDEFIPKWDEWAGKNQLPDNKLSAALGHWKMEEWATNMDFCYRTLVTRTVNAGPFGWSYFGATYHAVADDCEEDAGEAIAVGWKGFSSCGVRADYSQDVAFVIMQECVPDPGNRNFAECVHGGKCGDYKLGEMGRKLAQVPEEERNKRRDKYEKKHGCFHDVMTETTGGCFTGCIQGIVRCAYFTFLPCGVKALRFHKSEHLGTQWKRDAAGRASAKK